MPDFAAIARQSTRNEFAATFPFPFLVGATPFVESRGSIKTLGLLDDVDDEEDEKTAALSSDPRFPARGPKGLTVLAVRKMTGESPDRISIGRTGRNDLVLEHPQISTFHAYFTEAGGFTLSDAGSRNGTWVSGRLLIPKGPPSQVLVSGDSVRFAQLEFTFMSPTTAWDVLRVMTK